MRISGSFELENLEPRLQLSAAVATTSDASGPADPSAVTARLPDLTPWVSRDKGYLYGWTIDRGQSPGHTLLLLTTAIENIGQGALEVRGGAPHEGGGQDVYQRIYNSDGTYSDRLAGIFTYHPAHHHTHFDDFSAYRIREMTPDGGVGKVLASASKVSFCLTDSDSVDPAPPDASKLGKYFACSTKVQGISVGWADVYSASLEGQSIDVTNLKSGKYWLEVEVDPDNHIVESDESNNIARIAINYHEPIKQKNDDFASRIVLRGAHPIAKAANTAASREVDEPNHAGVTGGASLWWSWTAPKSGTVTISTSGSTFDTLLGVYTGDELATLKHIAANDDAEGHRSSIVSFKVTAGTTYQIAVDGYRGATGIVKLSISLE